MTARRVRLRFPDGRTCTEHVETCPHCGRPEVCEFWCVTDPLTGTRYVMTAQGIAEQAITTGHPVPSQPGRSWCCETRRADLVDQIRATHARLSAADLAVWKRDLPRVWATANRMEVIA